MQEREFKKLLNKYLEGSISEEEEALLKKFEQGLESRGDGRSFDYEDDRFSMEKLLWSHISNRIAVNGKIKKSVNWRIVASAAVVLIGFLTVGYYYMNDSNSHLSNVNSENFITLQLQDGSVQIIKDNGTAKITDKKGVILGQQKGNELIYSEKSSNEELVLNTINVPYGKTFQLQLSDGTKVYLNAGSSLQYPVEFLKNQNRHITVSGEIYLEVTRDSLRPFVANANNINVRVLGTKFNISAYPEDRRTEVVLVEGSVSLFSNTEVFNLDDNTVLKPGFMGSYDLKKKAFTTNQVHTEVYTSWMDGKLIFRNMTFENILKKLERHYNVTIINSNIELSDKKFNANFGSEPIQNVLEELKINYGIDYEITEDRTVLIK